MSSTPLEPETRSTSSRPARSAPLPTGAWLRLSVVIPTFHRPDLIVRCLEALVAQSLDAAAFEIIVVDDGRSADTQAAVCDVAGRYPAHTIRYTRPTIGHGPAAARNAGWRAARAALIAFTDDDTVPERDWLANGERALADDVVAVAGRVRVPPPVRASGRSDDGPTDHELMTRGLERAEFITANAFVRRIALAEVGGFDERFERAWREDSDLQFRLLKESGRIVPCADAVVVHPVRPERWGVSLHQQKNIFYDALLFKKHPRLYRERILSAPPWDYYAVVALSIAAAGFSIAGVAGSALASAAVALLLIAALARRRLRDTSRAPAHVVEMLVTSVAIPFLSVYWRLRGALHFRVAYF